MPPGLRKYLRVRTSTAALTVFFIGVLALYFYVRPAGPDPATGHRSSQTAHATHQVTPTRTPGPTTSPTPTPTPSASSKSRSTPTATPTSSPSLPSGSPTPTPAPSPSASAGAPGG
jgi:hypothetical protein